MLLSLVGTLALLDRRELSWPWFVLAVVIAVIGSFSSLQGLLIWAAGLILLYYRKRHIASIVIWIGSAVVVTVVYFYNFHASAATPDRGYALHHPLRAVKFYFFLIGDIVG